MPPVRMGHRLAFHWNVRAGGEPVVRGPDAASVKGVTLRGSVWCTWRVVGLLQITRDEHAPPTHGQCLSPMSRGRRDYCRSSAVSAVDALTCAAGYCARPNAPRLRPLQRDHARQAERRAGNAGERSREHARPLQQQSPLLSNAQRARRAIASASSTAVLPRRSSTVPRACSSRSTRLTVARDVPAISANCSWVSGITESRPA